MKKFLRNTALVITAAAVMLSALTMTDSSKELVAAAENESKNSNAATINMSDTRVSTYTIASTEKEDENSETGGVYKTGAVVSILAALISSLFVLICVLTLIISTKRVKEQDTYEVK